MVLLEAAADRHGTRDEFAPLKLASRWQTLLPLVLVLLSLLSLAILPFLLERRLATLRETINDVAEPVRSLVTEVELALAVETAGTNAYLLTGDPRYFELHSRARAARERALATLLPLAHRLGPDIVDDARTVSTRLHASDELLDALYSGRMSRQELIGRMDELYARFEAAIAAADQLEVASGRVADAQREGIRQVTRHGVVVTALLVLLALVAAAFVARLGGSYRSLAIRLDRRARQEAALRVTARRLSDALRIQEVVQTAAECAVDSMHAFGAYVERAETVSPNGEVEVLAASGAGTPPVGTSVAYPGSLTEKIIESGEPQIMTDVGAIGERMAPYLRQYCKGCSGLIVPLYAEREILGAMVLLRDPREECFTPVDVRQARALGDLASAALRRVMLLEALAESEERFRQIAENIREFVWLSDPQFKRLHQVNSGYERIWGRSRETLYESPVSFFEGIHQDDRARVIAALPGLPHGEYDIEFRVVRPDGEVRWVRSRGFPVRSARGETYRAAGITEDITERKQIEWERERLLASEQAARAASEAAQSEAELRRRELERVTESRARLVRGFTHDVKNPLGAADGLLALLEDGVVGELADAQRGSVERARRSIRVALDLIDHLMELARAETGQLELEYVAMDVRATAREVAEEYRAQAEMNGLTLTLELPSELPKAESDPARVRQVLTNLVSNAVKFTPEGGRVTVRAAARSGSEAPGPGEWVVVQVADTGPGISSEQQSMLFKEFTRLAPSVAHGTGIGLAISQRIAHALGGAITVDSKEGAGSTFTLWLPITEGAGTGVRDAGGSARNAGDRS